MASRKVAAENARGLKELEKLQRTPGLVAPGTSVPSGRLHGKFAMCSWAGVTSAILCFDWEVNFEQEFADGTAHGEYWDIPVPIKQMWTGRAQAYVLAGGPGANAEDAGWVTWMAQNILLFRAGKTAGDRAVASFTGWAHSPITGGSNATQYIFKGDAYVSRASFSAPRNGAATQEIALRGYGAPTTGTQDS